MVILESRCMMTELIIHVLIKMLLPLTNLVLSLMSQMQWAVAGAGVEAEADSAPSPPVLVQ